MKRLIFTVFQEGENFILMSNGRQPLSTSEMVGLAAALIQLSNSLERGTMQRKPEYVIEREYHGYELYTDGKKFFARDDKGERVGESTSLDGVKGQLLKATPLDIKAVILAGRYGYYYDDDDEDGKPQTVRIYGISGAGAILYEEPDGTKRKASSRHSGLRRLEEGKLAEYLELKAQERTLKAKLDALLKGWKELEAEDLRGKENAVGPVSLRSLPE